MRAHRVLLCYFLQIVYCVYSVIVTICQRSCGKVMCLSVCPQGGRGSHVTITHDALDLTVQPPSGHGTSMYRDPRQGTSLYRELWPSLAPSGHRTPLQGSLVKTSGGQHFIPVQSCSPHDPPWYWHLVAKTGDLFKLVHLRNLTVQPLWYWHLVAIDAQTHPTGMLSCLMLN